MVVTAQSSPTGVTFRIVLVDVSVTKRLPCLSTALPDGKENWAMPLIPSFVTCMAPASVVNVKVCAVRCQMPVVSPQRIVAAYLTGNNIIAVPDVFGCSCNQKQTYTYMGVHHSCGR